MSNSGFIGSNIQVAGDPVRLEQPIVDYAPPRRTPQESGSGGSSGRPTRSGSNGSTGSSPDRTPRSGGIAVDPGIGKDDPRTPTMPAPKKDSNGGIVNRTPRNDNGGSRNGSDTGNSGNSGGGGGGSKTPTTTGKTADPGIGNGGPITPVLYPGPGIDPSDNAPSASQATDIFSQFPNIDMNNLPSWAIPAGMGALALLIFASR